MAQTKQEYQFIDGNGDKLHAAALSTAGGEGWKVVQMEFDPDAQGDDKRLVVLLEKPL